MEIKGIVALERKLVEKQQEINKYLKTIVGLEKKLVEIRQEMDNSLEISLKLVLIVVFFLMVLLCPIFLLLTFSQCEKGMEKSLDILLRFGDESIRNIEKSEEIIMGLEKKLVEKQQEMEKSSEISLKFAYQSMLAKEKQEKINMELEQEVYANQARILELEKQLGIMTVSGSDLVPEKSVSDLKNNNVDEDEKDLEETSSLLDRIIKKGIEIVLRLADKVMKAKNKGEELLKDIARIVQQVIKRIAKMK
ncbi:uncharacterized protein LOC126653664 [Mercurialis annua]|uniref:uncharacterized protein LOC126653664 n=1 Tax=Mercurialis annua TaxID=3986 RepID=UPI00215F20C9|nr:uncharacterized protein LOC126653664 [Mercurialis annua]